MRPPRTVAQPLRLPRPDSSGRSARFAACRYVGQVARGTLWVRPMGPADGSGRLAIGHPSEARTSFRLTPAPPTPRPSASPPHTRPRRSPEDALPPCQAPAPAPAAAGGLLRRIFPRERQRDIRRVLLLIHLEVRLGSPEPLEHPLFLDPIQKIIGILRI